MVDWTSVREIKGTYMKFGKLLCAIGATMLLAGGLMAQAPAATPAQDQQMKAMVDALRKDLRTERQSIVDQAMGLDAAGKAKFWGIYEGYQKEMSSIWDARLANVKAYAESYKTMDAATADKLAATAFANQLAIYNLKKKYYGVYKTAMGPLVAARFAQVETTLNAMMDLQLFAQLPLIQ